MRVCYMGVHNAPWRSFPGGLGAAEKGLWALVSKQGLKGQLAWLWARQTGESSWGSGWEAPFLDTEPKCNGTQAVSFLVQTY
jgi:hypothetical protein